jgi:hypothetical protein
MMAVIASVANIVDDITQVSSVYLMPVISTFPSRRPTTCTQTASQPSLDLPQCPAMSLLRLRSWEWDRVNERGPLMFTDC